MSAICGLIGLDGRPYSQADLGGVARALTPLGRDGGGSWTGQAGRCGVAVAAALRHSTPQDTVDRQPAQSRDGSLVLVGDLRLDNRDELSASLGIRDPAALPDSTFVLAAYERWGEGLPDRMLGDFALALVDRRRGGVLLARDHVGTRPLVIHERPNVLAFASTALSLTALDGVGANPDMVHAAEWLLLLTDSDRTFVEGVRWFPPGSACWVDPSGVRSWTWWDPDPLDVVDLGSPAAQERELREALDRAVATRLRSTGAVGAMVSGGLDSTSVAATAAPLLAPEPLRTYTAAPPRGWHGAERSGRDLDESSLVVQLAARHPNMRPSFIHAARGESLLRLHEPLWELGAGPARYSLNSLWLHPLRAQAGAEGVTTLLTGSRGNFQFSADGPGWIAALVRSGRLGRARRELAAWARASGDGLAITARRHLVYPLLPAVAQRLARAVRGQVDPLEDWVAYSALRPEVVASLNLAERLPLLDARGPADMRLGTLLMLRGTADTAETESALAALTGVDERDPTGDRRVLEAGMRQPEWARRHDGIDRAVARGAMAERLPPAIARRTRRGEQLPEWLDLMTDARLELATEVDELKQHPASRELIDTERLEGLLDHWPARMAHGDRRVERDYLIALSRALLLSRYLRWFGARAPGRASSS